MLLIFDLGGSGEGESAKSYKKSEPVFVLSVLLELVRIDSTFTVMEAKGGGKRAELLDQKSNPIFDLGVFEFERIDTPHYVFNFFSISFELKKW